MVRFGPPFFAGLMVLALAACAESSRSTPAAVSAPAPAPIPAAPLLLNIPPPPPPAPVSEPTIVFTAPIDFDQQVKPFFANYCLQCHGQDRSPRGVNFSTKTGLLRRVTPGDPASSAIYNVIFGRRKSMPPLGMDQPTANEIATIKQWIIEGAKISASYPPGTPATAPAQ
jgi:uncharacterized membrane protein